MLLNLRELHGTHERVARHYAPAAFVHEPGDDYVMADEVALALDVVKDRDKYHLSGTLRTAVRLECCRCLESFAIPVDVDVDLLYLPFSANAGEGELEVEEDDLSTAYYREDQIDLGQLVREQIQLTLPMKPLCRQDCRGLCPECGVNLNLQTCRCQPRWADPRLDALKALTDKRVQ